MGSLVVISRWLGCFLVFSPWGSGVSQGKGRGSGFYVVIKAMGRLFCGQVVWEVPVLTLGQDGKIMAVR